MKVLRFRAKIVLCVLLLLAFAFSFGSSLLIALSFKNAVSERRQAAGDAYSMILYTLDAVQAVSALGFEELAVVTLRQLDEREMRSWQAIRLTQNDRCVYDSGADAAFAAVTPTLGKRCLQTVYTPEGTVLLQISGMLIAAENSYALEVLFDISSPYAMKDAMLTTFRRVFLIVLAVGAAVSFILGWFISRPLSQLSDASRRIAAGELNSRALITSRDEVGQLAADFNLMAERIEAQIRDLEESVERQETFMAAFAHELKTPMTSIIGYSDLLRSGGLSDKDNRMAANFIYSEGRRLESLAVKLLELLVAGREDIGRQQISLPAFMKDIHASFAPVARKNSILLECSGEGEGYFEPDLIKSLLLNLADNARKATDRGGSIQMTAVEKNGICRFTVSDTGIGIPKEVLSRVTEVFYRVDKSRARAHGGAGIGLALCARIAAVHGGELTVSSEEGKGCEVTVIIPKEGGRGI